MRDQSDLFAWLAECLIHGDENVEILVVTLGVRTAPEAAALLKALADVTGFPKKHDDFGLMLLIRLIEYPCTAVTQRVIWRKGLPWLDHLAKTFHARAGLGG